MKKYTVYSMILLVILAIFSGCTTSNINSDIKHSIDTNSSSFENAKCFITSISNMPFDASIEYSSKYYPWNGMYFESDSAKKSISVEFDSVVYSGDYWKSICQKYNSFTTDIYHDAVGLEFGVKADSNEVVFVNYKTKDFFNTEPYLDDLVDPKAQTLAIANACAEKYIDLSSYTLQISEPVIDTYASESDEKEYSLGYHTFDYVRYINGIPTSDYLAIQVTSKGSIASILFGDKDGFGEDILESANKFSDIDYNSIIEPALIDAISVEGVELKSYKITEKYLAISPNNDIVLCVRITCDLENIQDRNVSYNAGVEMIIVDAKQ